MVKKEYFRIRLSTVRAFEQLPFDILLFLDGKLVTYLRQGEMLTGDKKASLHDKDSGESFFVTATTTVLI